MQATRYTSSPSQGNPEDSGDDGSVAEVDDTAGEGDMSTDIDPAVDGPHMGSPGPAVPGPSLITDMRTLSGGHRQHQQHLQQQQQQQAASSAGGTAAPLPTVAELEAPPPPPPQAAPQARAESSAQGSPPQRGPHHADQLEALSQRLQAAAASEARMVEQVAAQEAKLAQYEAQVQQLQQSLATAEQQVDNKTRELSVVHTKVQRLEQQLAKAQAQAQASSGRAAIARSVADIKAATAPAAAAAAASDAAAEELAALRREVEEQERLMQGYQQENEVAMRRIKELETSLKETATSHLTLSSRNPLALQPDGLQGPGASPSKQQVAARLAEVLALQQQLQLVQETSATREAELKQQIDRLRAEKKELELRKGGVDPAAQQAGDALVRRVQGEMEALRAQHHEVVAELQGKLRWYVENQELLSKQDVLVKEQQEVIAQLERRLAESEGPGGKAASQRVAELQAQVASLQQVLRTRGLPKSLAAVIEAAKPTASESGAVAALQAQVEHLQRKLAAKDEEYEVQLRSYQQQYEQLRVQWEERQAELQAQLKARRRESQLVAQVEEQRAMYTRQIKELKAKLQHAQAVAALPAGSRHSSAGAAAALDPAHGSLVPASLLRAKESEVARLQQELQRKTKQVAEMHLRLGESEAKVVRLAHGTVGSTPPLPGSPLQPPNPSASPLLLKQQAAALRDSQQPRDSGPVVERFAEDAGAAAFTQQPFTQQPRPAQVAALQAEAESLRRRAEAAELNLEAMRRAYLDAQERCAALQAEQGKATEREQSVLRESQRLNERLVALHEEVQSARARAAAAEAELARASRDSNWQPAAHEFAALERRIESMAREAEAREAKWQDVLQDARELHALQAELAAKHFEAGLAKRDAELESLRARVTELLASAARLQQPQHLHQQRHAARR